MYPDVLTPTPGVQRPAETCISCMEVDLGPFNALIEGNPDGPGAILCFPGSALCRKGWQGGFWASVPLGLAWMISCDG